MAMHILLTAFEPFGGDAVNPTQHIVDRLAVEPPPGLQLTVSHLPVVAREATALVAETVRRIEPDAVVSLGLAAGYAEIAIERVAINVNDFRIPDNSGLLLRDEPVVPDGPIGYWSTLPVRAMFDRLQAENIPVKISNSAGAYVCNHLFYSVLHDIHTNGLTCRAGFIHVPYLPEQVVEKPGTPALPFDVMTRAIGMCLEIVGG